MASLFRELLTTMGDRYTEDQVDELFRDAPIKVELERIQQR